MRTSTSESRRGSLQSVSRGESESRSQGRQNYSGLYSQEPSSGAHCEAVDGEEDDDHESSTQRQTYDVDPDTSQYDSVQESEWSWL
jgi:hypothetical protein